MEDQVTSSQQYRTPGMLPEENNYYVDPEGQRFSNPAEFDQAVQQGQVASPPRPSQQPPQPQQEQQPGVVYNVPDFQAMREAALQQAIEQVTARRQVFPQEQPQVPQVPQNAPQQTPTVLQAPPQPVANPSQPKVVYVRRNLTLAEILVVLALSCGLVTGTQFVWNAGADVLSRIEIRDK